MPHQDFSNSRLPSWGLAPEQSLFRFPSVASLRENLESVLRIVPEKESFEIESNLVISGLTRTEYVEIEELLTDKAKCHSGDLGPYDSLVHVLNADASDLELLYYALKTEFPDKVIGINEQRHFKGIVSWLVVHDNENFERVKELAEKIIVDPTLSVFCMKGRCAAELKDPLGSLVMPKQTYSQYVRRAYGEEIVEQENQDFGGETEEE